MLYCEECRRVHQSPAPICPCGGALVLTGDEYYDGEVECEMRGPNPVPPPPCIWCNNCGADTPHRQEAGDIACIWCGSTD